MRRYLWTLALTSLLFSCHEASHTHNFTLRGTVEGVKKGTLYLDKLVDTTAVTIDSVALSGSPDFVLSADLDQPQMLFLYLKKTESAEQYDQMGFFAEPGEIELRTTLKNFESDAIISGSQNHDLLVEHQKLMARYNDKNLDLIKEELEAARRRRDKQVDDLVANRDKLLRTRYLTSVNFILQHPDKEVAPYLALTHLAAVSPTYLDTLYKSLTPAVQQSLYGKALQQYVSEL